MEKPRAKKPLKTYGSQGRDLFELHVTSDGQFDITTPKRSRFEESKPKRSQNTYDRAGTLSSGNTEVLELRLDSTDNIALSGSSMLPLALGSTSTEHPSGLDGTSFLKPVSGQSSFESESLYSKEKTPIGALPSQDPAIGLDSPEKGANSSRKRSRDEMEALDGQHDGLAGPSLSNSVFSVNTTTTVAGTSLSFSPPHEDCVLEDPILPLHSNTHNVTELLDHGEPLPKQVQNDELLDELSLSVPTASGTSKCQIKPQKNPECSDQRRDDLGSDDDAVGLPKDNYQPRPSKSRSGRGNGELLIPADYSKRPEALSKKKRKLSRRKTTAFHELIPKEEFEEEDDGVVHQASFAARTTKVPKVVTEQDELHLNNTAKAEVDQEANDPDLESVGKPIGSTKQRGRPKKAAMLESLEHETTIFEKRVPSVKPTTEACRPENEADPQLAKQVTESKKQRGRPKKGAAETSKATSSEANDAHIEKDVEPEDPNHTAIAKESQKNRRDSGAFMAISEGLIQDSDDDFDAADEGGSVSNRVLKETQGKSLPSKPAEEVASSPSPSKSKSVPPETPNKKGSLSKGPNKHSPISSGKVSYRVGLSKRQRIAPLLRIVRKS